MFVRKNEIVYCMYLPYPLHTCPTLYIPALPFTYRKTSFVVSVEQAKVIFLHKVESFERFF